MSKFDIFKFVFDCVKDIFSDWKFTGIFSGRERVEVFSVIVRSTLCVILITSLIAYFIDMFAEALFSGSNLPGFVPMICGYIVKKSICDDVLKVF